MRPAGHQRMSIKDRSENSVAGFVLVDLFNLLSRITAARARIPQTACFLAPQTKENLQRATCLMAMTICYTKATQGDYWRSANRVSEISIEKFFGRLRAQAYARGCGHVGEARRQQAANKPEKYSVQKQMNSVSVANMDTRLLCGWLLSLLVWMWPSWRRCTKNTAVMEEWSLIGISSGTPC